MKDHEWGMIILVEAPIVSYRGVLYVSLVYCTVRVQYTAVHQASGVKLEKHTFRVGMTQVSRFFMCGSNSCCTLFDGRVSCDWLLEG